MKSSELENSVWDDQNGDMATVTKTTKFGWYACTNEYDFSAPTIELMLAKLKNYGFRFNGYD